jgi:hypothetical protein
MQAAVNAVCLDLISKVSDGDIGNFTYTLPMLLKAINRPNFQDTLRYIKNRQDTLNTLSQSNGSVSLNYQTLLLAILKEIRGTAEVVSSKQLLIPCTGQVKASHCMCLYVCGLLSPPQLSFLDLTQGNDEERAYADAFFDSVFADPNLQITVAEISSSGLDVDNKLNAMNDPSAQEKVMGVSGKSFICARKRAPQNMAHENILVLDAFSDVSQLVEYDVAVWHPYCLWAFAQTQQPILSCYGVKTGTKSFVFMGNYMEHSEQRRLSYKSNQNAADGVRDLIVKPLTMYRHNCTQMGVADHDPKGVADQLQAVISRSWQNNIDVYLPLAYVHLLVRPTAPHYADVAYGNLLQDILKYAVGQQQAYIVQSLQFTDQTTLIQNSNPPNMLGIVSLCQEHHDLMLAHKFVFPENATQQEILFDEIEDGAQSQHNDYIAALCDVRYNWVFTREHKAAWNLVPLGNNATFHEIDVHRHITHFQATHDTKSDLLKPLSTGFHVTDSAGRKGVIIFDFQSFGRLHEYFTGDTASRTWIDTLKMFVGALIENTAPAVKEPQSALFGAMKKYFGLSTSPSKINAPTLWTLSDMTYKYAVLQDDNKIFIQDSHELTPDNTPPSCERCLFCPACLMETRVDLDMRAHITGDHPDYYLTDSPASVAGSSFDPSASSVDFENGSNKSLQLKEDAEHERTGLEILELRNKTESTDNADETQAHVSASNYAALEKKYVELQAFLDKHKDEQQDIIDSLKEDIRKLQEQVQMHETDVTQKQTVHDDLQEKLKAAQEQKQKDDLALTERQIQKSQDTLQLQEEHKKTLEEKQKEMDAQNAQLTQLQKDIEQTTQDAAQQKDELDKLRLQVKEKDDEIARLTAANAALLLQILELEEQLAASKLSRSTATSATDAQIQGLQQELDRTKKELIASETKATAANQDAQHLQADLTALQTKMTAQNDLLAHLQAHLSSERQEISEALRSKRETSNRSRTPYPTTCRRRLSWPSSQRNSRPKTTRRSRTLSSTESKNPTKSGKQTRRSSSSSSRWAGRGACISRTRPRDPLHKVRLFSIRIIRRTKKSTRTSATSSSARCSATSACGSPSATRQKEQATCLTTFSSL